MGAGLRALVGRNVALQRSQECKDTVIVAEDEALEVAYRVAKEATTATSAATLAAEEDLVTFEAKA